MIAPCNHPDALRAELAAARGVLENDISGPVLRGACVLVELLVRRMLVGGEFWTRAAGVTREQVALLLREADACVTEIGLPEEHAVMRELRRGLMGVRQITEIYEPSVRRGVE